MGNPYQQQTLKYESELNIVFNQTFIFNNNIRPFIVLSIFDAFVKPKALYNCEVWIGFESVIRKINKGNV